MGVWSFSRVGFKYHLFSCFMKRLVIVRKFKDRNLENIFCHAFQPQPLKPTKTAHSKPKPTTYDVQCTFRICENPSLRPTAVQCLTNWICVLQCLWSQHPYGAWNNKQLCVCQERLCVWVRERGRDGWMAAERFINPVYQGSVGFTQRHWRLRDVSTTQARQFLSKILIWGLIFNHNKTNTPPTPSNFQSRDLQISTVCFHSLWTGALIRPALLSNRRDYQQQPWFFTTNFPLWFMLPALCIYDNVQAGNIKPSLQPFTSVWLSMWNYRTVKAAVDLWLLF